MPNLDPSQIRVAATGAFWKAPLGSTLPTDSTTAYPAAYANFGYQTNGFTLGQDLKTTTVSGWQSLEPLLLINQSRSNTLAFENLQSNQANLSLAWGNGSAVGTAVPVGGAVTIGTAGLITTASAHGLSVGAPVQLVGVTTSTGITSLTTYWIISVGSSTTFTLSATLGGAALTTTAGTATSVAPAYPVKWTFPDTAIANEFVLGVDYSHNAFTARLVFPRVALTDLPDIKFVRDDAVRYSVAVQVLKPLDGSQSFIPYYNDIAAIS